MTNSDPIFFLSVSRAAQSCAIGRSKFYELIRDGKVRTTKVGRRTLVSITELERLAASLIEQSEGE